MLVAVAASGDAFPKENVTSAHAHPQGRMTMKAKHLQAQLGVRQPRDGRSHELSHKHAVADGEVIESWWLLVAPRAGSFDNVFAKSNCHTL